MSGKKKGARPVGSPQRDRVTTSGDALVSVSRQIQPGPDGTTGVTLTLNLADLPVPARRYSADGAFTDVRGDVVRLMFFQQGVFDEALRTLLVVRLYPESIRRFLSSCDSFMGNLQRFRERNSLPSTSGPRPEHEPSHVVIVDANVVSVGYSGREAEFDFFRIGAQAVGKVSRSSTDEVEVEPVVRVNCSSAVMESVLLSLQEMVESLPPDVT